MADRLKGKKILVTAAAAGIGRASALAFAAEGAEVIDLDGVRVKTADGWWLLRASNTQDVLVARCESTDEAGLATLKATVTAQLKASGLEAPWV